MSGLTIGVRDSGVGGLTVARQLKKVLPGARILYFADTAHVPYGEKTPAQVRHYALSISDFLILQGAQAVVFACNTTSALALDLARERFETPIFGVLRPGAHAAAAQSEGKIGVLATAATVQSGVYSRVLCEARPDLEVLEVACPAFVPLVESRRTDSAAAKSACREYLAPLQKFGADTTILGCTHYPLLLPLLQEIAPKMRFLDPAEAVAGDVAAYFDIPTETPTQNDVFYVSGPQTGVREWIQDLLQIPNPKLQIAPVF